MNDEQNNDNKIEQINQQTQDKQINTINSEEENINQQNIQNQEEVLHHIQIEQEILQNQTENNFNEIQFNEEQIDENKLPIEEQDHDNFTIIQNTEVDQNLIQQTHLNLINENIIKDDTIGQNQKQHEPLQQIQDNQQSIEDNELKNQTILIEEVNQIFLSLKQNIQIEQEIKEQDKDEEQDISQRIVTEESIQQQQLEADVPEQLILQEQNINENTLSHEEIITNEKNQQDEANILLDSYLNDISQTKNQHQQLEVDVSELIQQEQNINQNTLGHEENIIKENNEQDQVNILLDIELNDISQVKDIQTQNQNEYLMQDENATQENQDQKSKQSLDNQLSVQDTEKINDDKNDDYQQVINPPDQQKQDISLELREGESETQQPFDETGDTNKQVQNRNNLLSNSNLQENQNCNPDSVVSQQYHFEKKEIESSNTQQLQEEKDEVVDNNKEFKEENNMKELLLNNQDEILQEQDQIQSECTDTLLEQSQQKISCQKNQIQIEDQKCLDIFMSHEDFYRQLSLQDINESQTQQQQQQLQQNDLNQPEINNINDSLINDQDLDQEKQKTSCKSKLEDEIESLNNLKTLDCVENDKSKDPVQDQIFKSGFYVSPIKNQKNDDNFEDLVSDLIDDQDQDQQLIKKSEQKILVEQEQNDQKEEQNSNQIDKDLGKTNCQVNEELLEDCVDEQFKNKSQNEELCLRNGQKINYIEIIKKYEQENLNESISIINDNLDKITDNNLLYQHLKKISARRSAAKSSTKKLLSQINIDKENLLNNENHSQLDRKSVSKLHHSKSISKQSVSSKISSINKMNYDTKESLQKNSLNKERNECIKVNLLNEFSESEKNKIQDYEQLAGESKLSNIYPFDLQSRITIYDEEEKNMEKQKDPFYVIDEDEEQRLQKFLLNLREPCSFSMIQSRFPYHRPSEILATIEEMKQQKKLNTVQMFLNKKLKYHSVRMEYYDTDQHILNNLGQCDSSDQEENTEDKNQENVDVEDKNFEFKDLNKVNEEEELSSYKKSLSIHLAYLEQKKKQLDTMSQIHKKQEQLKELMNIGNNLFNRLATIKNQNITQIKQNYGIQDSE
ncbi:hypothetical protein ABPG72_008944 [Tetrahymena utriculariae]